MDDISVEQGVGEHDSPVLQPNTYHGFFMKYCNINLKTNYVFHVALSYIVVSCCDVHMMFSVATPFCVVTFTGRFNRHTILFLPRFPSACCGARLDLRSAWIMSS